MTPAVLIVDDELAICHNLAAYLEDEGMRVRAVQTGEEALQYVATGGVADVCIMDLRLPGMSGPATIMALRARLPALRFIVHSGSTPADVAGELARTGLREVPIFTKPISDMGRLVGVITAG
ncbi:MAG: response regulator [Thiotrichales bacterium]